METVFSKPQRILYQLAMEFLDQNSARRQRVNILIFDIKVAFTLRRFMRRKMVVYSLLNFFLFFKWPSLLRITSHNTLCVNAP